MNLVSKSTLVCILLLSGCSNKMQIRTPEEFGESLFSVVKNNNKTDFKELLITQKDVINIAGLKWRTSIAQIFVNDSTQNLYLNHERNQINEIRKAGTKEGVNWDNVVFKKTEYHIKTKDSIEILKGSILFTSEGRDYEMYFRNAIKVGTDWKGFDIDDIIDVKKEAEERELFNKNKIKRDEEIAKHQLLNEIFRFDAYWRQKSNQPTYFEEFKINLKNTSENRYTYIKYKVLLYYFIEGTETMEIFNRTYERDGNIFPDDKINFEVLDLRGFYAGIDISVKNSFYFDIDVLDAR